MTEKIQIHDNYSLGLLLGRTYWLESEMELMIQWEAYKKLVGREEADVLFRLASDSAQHKLAIMELSSNLGDFDLDEIAKEIKPETVDFSNMDVSEIFGEILRYENIAQDLYKRMRSLVPKEFVAQIWKGDDPVDYYRTINMLIKAEQTHIDLVKPLVGTVSRIR